MSTNNSLEAGKHCHRKSAHTKPWKPLKDQSIWCTSILIHSLVTEDGKIPSSLPLPASRRKCRQWRRILHLQTSWLVISSLTLQCLLVQLFYAEVGSFLSCIPLFSLLYFPLFSFNDLLVATRCITIFSIAVFLNGLKVPDSKILVSEMLDICSFLAFSLAQKLKE